MSSVIQTSMGGTSQSIYIVNIITPVPLENYGRVPKSSGNSTNCGTDGKIFSQGWGVLHSVNRQDNIRLHSTTCHQLFRPIIIHTASVLVFEGICYEQSS